MCLIPTRVIREIGLSLPMFIKWDDAEFGLRAREAGYPTVTMPGVAVWHVPWTEKDDTLDWQAYFHERNRLISGLLHSPYERGGRLVMESLENHVKRLMSMQYSTGETILMALSDVLEGPERMHRDMTFRLKELRGLRDQYADGRSSADLDAFPAPRLKKPPRRGRGVPNPGRHGGQGQDGRHRPGAPAAADPGRWPRSTRRASCPTSTSAGTGWPTSTPPSSRPPTAWLRRGTAATPPSSGRRSPARPPCTSGSTRSGRSWRVATARRCRS